MLGLNLMERFVVESSSTSSRHILLRTSNPDETESERFARIRFEAMHSASGHTTPRKSDSSCPLTHMQDMLVHPRLCVESLKTSQLWTRHINDALWEAEAERMRLHYEHQRSMEEAQEQIQRQRAADREKRLVEGGARLARFHPAESSTRR